MQKVVEFSQKNPVQYLATVGRDGKAKCRSFMFCFEQDGKDAYEDQIDRTAEYIRNADLHL